jgi:hypothetical protein
LYLKALRICDEDMQLSRAIVSLCRKLTNTNSYFEII